MNPAPEPVPAPGTAIPDSGPHTPEPADTSTPQPAADPTAPASAMPGGGPSPAPSATGDRVGTDVPQDVPERSGFPVGQWAVGGVSVTAIAGEVLWQVAGLPGLLATGAIAVGGLVLATGHRRNRADRKTAARNGVTPGGRGRTAPARLWSGGRTAPGNRAGGRPAGRTLPTGRGARPGTGGRGVPLLGGRTATGRPGTGTSTGRPAAGHGQQPGRRPAPATGGKNGHSPRSAAAPAGGSSTGATAKGRSRRSPWGAAGSAVRRAGSRAARTKPARWASTADSRARQAAGQPGSNRRRLRAARRSWSRSLYRGRRPLLRLLAALTAAPLALLSLLWGWWKSRRTTTDPEPAITTEQPTPTNEPRTDRPNTGRPEQPAPEPHRDRHNNRPRSASRRSFTVTAGFPLAVAAADVNTAAASYNPPDMWKVAADLRQLPDVFASIALALRTYTTVLEGGFPIDRHVVEAIAQLYAGIAQVAVAAQEVEPLFRRVHADDLKRDEAPRTNEPAWNV